MEGDAVIVESNRAAPILAGQAADCPNGAKRVGADLIADSVQEVGLYCGEVGHVVASVRLR